MKQKVLVVLVTYNRSENLTVVLDAIENQSIPVYGILVVDNKSVDDTQDILQKRGFLTTHENCLHKKETSDQIVRYYYRNSENLGGAGGFSKAIELALTLPIDFLWIMDDDVEPEKDCLEILKKSITDKVKVCIPNRTDEYFQDHACLNIDMKSLIKFRITKRKQFAEIPLTEDRYSVKDMPFEGPLISIDVAKKVGLPNKGYFIEYDDTDYATRILKFTEIHFISGACLHRQFAKKNLLDKKIKSRKYTWRNYYSIRNNILFNHKYAETWRAKHLSTFFIWSWHILRSVYYKEFANISIINSAVKDGMKDKYGKMVSQREL